MKYENVTEVFNSVNEFYAALQKRSVNETFKEIQYSQRVGEESFFGTSNMDSANELLLNGDAKNSKKLQAVNVKTESNQFTERLKKQTTRSVAGFMPCIPVYLSGQPRNMFSIKNVYHKAKIINMAIGKSMPYIINADDMIIAGAKIASAICSLEKSGIRINLYIGATVEKKGQKLTCLVKIKNAGAPLNKLRITYPIVNPAFLRRHYFRWMETCQSNLKKDFSRCYGTPVNLDASIIPDSKTINLFEVIDKKLSHDDIVKKLLS